MVTIKMFQLHSINKTGVKRMKKIKIVAIVGSLRKESYNLKLAFAAKEIIGERADFVILDYQNVPIFNEDFEYPAPDSVKKVREEVKSATGIWFFTPEYNHSISGALKNLIDWLSRAPSEKHFQVLSKKPVVISGISVGMCGTAIAQDHLIALISLLNMEVMNYPRVTIPNAISQFDSEGKLINNTSYLFLEKQANNFVKFIEKRIE